MADADALPVPAELQPTLARHPGVDWAGVVAESLRAKAEAIERAEAVARRSKLSAEQARALGARLREGDDAPRA
ncbi:MAG TPA: hypothetical protein VGR28_13635 [Candidatus Thermoplasmatota archaeon]|jgi:hypothetical protein|nr:hypothetical protein [Candidatus Thermoplasmatota archaeon]